MARKKDYRELLKTPFDTGIRNFTTIAKYFLYFAPSIDSAHSTGNLDDIRSGEILARMLARSGMTGKTRIMQRPQQASWRNAQFDSYEIDFEESRILCDRYKAENELHALLRHTRNALAHGYVYVWKKRNGNFILLIDFDSGKNKSTAKILVTSSIMERWKAELENEIL